MKKTKMFGRIGMTLVFAVITFTCLFPFYVLPVMGSYTTEELMKTLPFWFGSSFFKNTQTLLQSNFLRTYANSAFVTIFSIVGSVFNSVLISYAITKYRFKARKWLEAAMS